MTKNEVLLSIIIPAYNAGGTILRALNFVNSCNLKQLIEIIIVNDGSADNTDKICDDFIRKHRLKHVIIRLVNQENNGHGSAINYGIKHAQGKYLRIMDADDFFETKWFDDYLDFLSHCEEDLVCSDYVEVRGKERNVLRWHKKGKTFIGVRYSKVINETTPYLLPCVAVRTMVLRNAGAEVDERCYYDDQEYDFLIIQLCSTVSYYAFPIYCYIMGDEEQSISQKSLVKNIKDHQKVVEWLVERYYKSKLSANKKLFVFKKMLVPLCYYQYYIAVTLKASRMDFVRFDGFLKKYKELYINEGVAGRRIQFHRMTRGLFIKEKK